MSKMTNNQRANGEDPEILSALFSTWPHGLLAGAVQDVSPDGVLVEFYGVVGEELAVRKGIIAPGVNPEGLSVGCRRRQWAAPVDVSFVCYDDGEVRIDFRPCPEPGVGDEVSLVWRDGRVMYGRYRSQRIAPSPLGSELDLPGVAVSDALNAGGEA